MCNLYDVGPAPARQSKGWERRAVEAMGSLPKIFALRRTDRGLVLRRDPASGEIEPQTMRWGFRRDFSDCINNTRVDKLDSGIWAESWRDRRCVIPAAAFYEWSGGEKGAKQTYALQDTKPAGWLWIVGIWEDHRETGLCYSMLTTGAQGRIAEIHERMPVILPDGTEEAFLSANSASEAARFLDEARSDLGMFACLNPLKTTPAGPPVEDRLLF